MWWLYWLIAAVVLGIAEAYTLTLGFGLLAVAAVAAAVSAGLGAPVLVQVATFAVTGGVGLLAVRPIARRHLQVPPLTKEGSDALVGREAFVVSEVGFSHGVVHLAGEDWSARPYVDGLVIPVGARVDVLQIDGATALVHPRDAALGGPGVGWGESLSPPADPPPEQPGLNP